MSEYNSTFEQFQRMLNTEKNVLLSHLGTPAISFPAFTAYHKNQLWMVLYFKEVRQADHLHSLLKAVAFFNDELCMLWSTGLELISNTTTFDVDSPKTTSDLIALYGTPHAEFGGGNSTFQYLTDNGHMVFAQCEDDRVIEMRSVTLTELAKTFIK